MRRGQPFSISLYLRSGSYQPGVSSLDFVAETGTAPDSCIIIFISYTCVLLWSLYGLYQNNWKIEWIKLSTIGIGKALCPLIQEVSSNLKPFITMCLCCHYFHCCLFKNEKGKKQSLWKGKSCSRLQRSAIVQHPFHTGLSYSSWKMFPFLSSMTLVVILCSPRNYILNFLQYKQWKLSVSCPLLIFG